MEEKQKQNIFQKQEIYPKKNERGILKFSTSVYVF
jgi:hypothetical protein